MKNFLKYNPLEHGRIKKKTARRWIKKNLYKLVVDPGSKKLRKQLAICAKVLANDQG